MATKSQEILLKGNTTNASAVPSSLKVREIAINALDRSLFTNDGNSIVKLYTGTNKWFDVNGNANNALKADSVAWSGIKDKPSTFTPSAHTHTASDVSGLPTSLKNPYALTFGTKTYDGSAATTITASDLGALTAHQSIYAFTLQVNGTSQGVYNPASAAKTINIAVPTKTSEITNDSGFITSAAIPTALKNPYAVEIKANGVSLGTYDGSAVATFNLSAANVGAANKIHTHNASDISGLPTKLSAFNNDVGYITGITKSMVEGVLTGDITSHTHSYLPLSGGTIKGDILSSNMNVGIRWNVDYVGGWARNFLEFNAHKDNDATKALESVFKIGGFGEGTGYVFTYIGANSYNSAYNIRFYSNNTITIGTYEILHANNYNSYSPKLDGTGASGTWGISISGNAATATSADYANSAGLLKLVANQNPDTSSIGQIFATSYNEGIPSGSYAYLSGITLASNNDANYKVQLALDYYGKVFSRWQTAGTWRDWNRLAFTTDNVASATKLQDDTAYTAWGQTFFQSGKPKNVSGDLSMEMSKIYWNGDIKGSFISSNGMTEMIYEMRGGHSFYVDGDMKLRITRFGNVLIGTANSNGYKLDVNGKGHYSDDLIVDGEVSALVA